MTDRADPFAATERYSGPERRVAPYDCEAGRDAMRMLVGDGRERGVFERLRSIETKIGILGVLLVAPLWMLALMAAADRWWPH